MSNNPTSLQADVPRRTATQASRRQTILVVEDEYLLRMEAAGEFRRQGFTVFEAGDTDEARNVLQSEMIDLLFTDVQIPGDMDGIALAKIARAMRPELKIVVVSGHVQAESIPKMADKFFSKPYNLNCIVAAIRTLLADRPTSATWRNSGACAKAASMGCYVA